MNTNNTQDVNNDKLINHVCHSLEQQSQQAHDFDLTLTQLAAQAQHARQHRLQQKKQHQHWFWFVGSMAMAASVAVFSFLPMHSILPNSTHQASVVVANNQATSPSVDPQFLEDIDMLMVLGDDTL